MNTKELKEEKVDIEWDKILIYTVPLYDSMRLGKQNFLNNFKDFKESKHHLENFSYAFMKTLRDYCNWKFPEEKRIYVISITRDGAFIRSEYSVPTGNMIKFKNEDSARLAINIINENPKYDIFVNTWLGIEQDET